MTKSDWERMRSGPLPMLAYYEYYNAMGGRELEFDVFTSLFNQALDMQLLPHVDGRGRMFTEQIARAKVYDYFEEKFS